VAVRTPVVSFRRPWAERAFAHPRQRSTWLAPPLAYAAFAAVWLGRGVLLHPESRVLGDRFPDKTIFMWSFLWWPHQLAHGHDPFVTKAVWAPHGVDLAWVTAMPGASLLLTPISETLGPVFAYNVAALAAPVLAASATFLLAQRLTRSSSASLVAGFMFGFSPYLMGESGSHLNLSLVFCVPLLGWLAVAFAQRDLSARRYVTFAALVLSLEFSFSTEIFATLTVVGTICLALTFLVVRELRARLRALAGFSAVAYVLAGALVLPYLWHAFAGATQPPARGVIPASADLANLLVPTKATWLRPPGSGSIAEHFASNPAEQGAYLGLPLLLILTLAAFTLRDRWRRGAWVLLLAAAATTALALGPRMLVDGHKIAGGVWTWIGHLPAIHSALPVRFDLYTGLFAALVTAIWLARPGARRGWRFALAALAVVTLLPTPSESHWVSTVPQSRFFTTTAYRAVLDRGETALVLPYGPTGWSMLWQAEAKFSFAMIGGWVGRSILPSECRWYWDYHALIGVRPPGGAAGFRRFLLAHHVGAVVEGPGTQRWARQLVAAALPDVRPLQIADATVLLLRRTLPARLPKSAPRLAPAGRPQRAPNGLPCLVPPYANS
jgi:hypothetical protein